MIATIRLMIAITSDHTAGNPCHRFAAQSIFTMKSALTQSVQMVLHEAASGSMKP